MQCSLNLKYKNDIIMMMTITSIMNLLSILIDSVCNYALNPLCFYDSLTRSLASTHKEHYYLIIIVFLNNHEPKKFPVCKKQTSNKIIASLLWEKKICLHPTVDETGQNDVAKKLIRIEHFLIAHTHVNMQFTKTKIGYYFLIP